MYNLGAARPGTSFTQVTAVRGETFVRLPRLGHRLTLQHLLTLRCPLVAFSRIPSCKKCAENGGDAGFGFTLTQKHNPQGLDHPRPTHTLPYVTAGACGWTAAAPEMAPRPSILSSTSVHPQHTGPTHCGAQSPSNSVCLADKDVQGFPRRASNPHSSGHVLPSLMSSSFKHPRLLTWMPGGSHTDPLHACGKSVFGFSARVHVASLRNNGCARSDGAVSLWQRSQNPGWVPEAEHASYKVMKPKTLRAP